MKRVSLPSPLVVVPTEWWPKIRLEMQQQDTHSDSRVNGDRREKKKKKKGKERKEGREEKFEG